MTQQGGIVNYVNERLQAGCVHGLERTEAGALAAQGGPGWYITPVFDTGAQDTEYGRLVLHGHFEDARLEVLVAATNTRTAVIDDCETDLASYLTDAEVPPAQKREVLCALPHLRRANEPDLLARGVRGRYVWVMVALQPAADTAPELHGLQLEVGWQPFTQYLPEIYQGNDFFERYISVFQALFLDLERRVDGLPALLDYETAPDEVVELLAGWLGIDNSRSIFTATQLRQLIARSSLFQGKKGTRAALEELVQLACGIRPRIVEHFQWMLPGLSAEQQETCRHLYGEGPDHFCLILDMTGGNTLPISEGDLDWLLEHNAPFGSRHKVVYLRPSQHTDTHCYLDINSVLSTPAPASVEDSSLGGHITVG